MPEGVIYMIEVIYKDEKQTAKGNEESFNLPKNIRQIGIPNEKYRIYIEDYVYTFLKKIAEKAEEEEKGAAAVFTGEIKWNSGTGYLFIRGALTAEAGEISAEHVEFSDLTWQKLHEEIEHYFAGQEIIGWFLTQKSLQMEVTEGVQRIHMKLFGGEKALMLMDPVEKEEAFFCYDNGRLLRQSGYYIYYEKNPQMQAYMLEKNPELLVMVEGTEVYPKEGYDWTAPRIDYTTMTEYYYGTWWGGNFRGAKKYPIDLGKYQSQLVYSPHDYGPLVWEQKWFYDGFTQETLLKDCWYDNWFFLQDEGVAPLLMGEWGGFMDGGKNEQWMTYLRDFMIENRIHHTFWCFNENSGDTGGLVYDNFGKWDEDKYALVKPALWQDDNGKFISLDHTIALGANGISLSDYYGSGNSSTTAPDSKIIAGDVNSDKLVNGVDLTLMRQNITKWQSTEDVLTASPQDTNGNGVFSVADIVLLTQYLLGKDVTLKSYTS